MHNVFTIAIKETIVGFGVVSNANGYLELIKLQPTVDAARASITEDNNPFTHIVLITERDRAYYQRLANTTRLRQRIATTQLEDDSLNIFSDKTNRRVDLVKRGDSTFLHSFFGKDALLKAFVCRHVAYTLTTDIDIVIP